MKNTLSSKNLLITNVCCLIFLIFNTQLLLVDSVWDFFVLLTLFMFDFNKLIENFKMKKNEINTK